MSGQEVLHLRDGDAVDGFQVVLTHCDGGDGPWEAEIYRSSSGRIVLLYSDDYEQVRRDALTLIEAVVT